MVEHKIVTIDGPGAAGKSTAALGVARRLGFLHLNSGALYRFVGLTAQRAGASISDDVAVSDIASKISFKFVLNEVGVTTLLVNDAPLPSDVFVEAVGSLASQVGVLPTVRKLLTDVQRDAAKNASVVLEGRDAGTVVFPNAQFKFYLDANLEERVRRRFDELQTKCHSCADGGVASGSRTLDDVRNELQTRDHRDSTREIAPQIRPKDAIAIDTTKMTIDEVIDYMCKVVIG